MILSCINTITPIKLYTKDQFVNEAGLT